MSPAKDCAWDAGDDSPVDIESPPAPGENGDDDMAADDVLDTDDAARAPRWVILFSDFWYVGVLDSVSLSSSCDVKAGCAHFFKGVPSSSGNGIGKGARREGGRDSGKTER